MRTWVPWLIPVVVEILVPGPEWCPARQKTRTQRVPITGEESLVPGTIWLQSLTLVSAQAARHQ